MNGVSKLTSYAGKKYKIMVGIIACVFLFLLSSRFIFNESKAIKDTEIGVETTQSIGTIKLVDRIYYSERNVLEFSFHIDRSGGNVLEELSAVVKSKRTDKEGYPVEVKRISDEYYVVFVSGIPSKWDTFMIDVGIKNDENSITNNAEKIYISKENIPQENEFKQHNQAFYELKYAQFIEKNTNELIIDYEKKVKGIKKNITKIESHSRELEKSLLYKTDKEKEEVQTKISSNDSQIETFKKEIEALNENISEGYEKLEVLAEKKIVLEKEAK